MKYAISIALLFLMVGMYIHTQTSSDTVCTFHPTSHQVHCMRAPLMFGRVMAIYDRRTGSHDQIVIFQVKAGKPVAKRIL
jgi:hypothetical protein